MSTVQDMKDEGQKPSPHRLLASRFRNGETLTYEQLAVLRDYCAQNGLHRMADRAREEIKAMSSGWKNEAS